MPSANTSTVAAIVVTYNRLEKLKNGLASLEAQTRLPEHLVIVNNASTDDTAAYLAEYERDFTLKDKVRITIVTLTENAGGAGGFSAGMRKGYELGADFVWIFDDDGYPQPAALAKLLEGYDNAVAGLGTDVPYVCSMVKFIDGSISEMNNPIPTWDWGRLQAMGYDNLVMVTSCSFVSVLIPRWVMEAFGLPYKEYFIWFDDAEYTLRITQSCPGVEVTDSIVLHDMGMNQGVNYSMVNDRNVWKFSYGARNEGSYRLHHRNVWQYLYFCLVVHNAMRRGRVAKPLRRKIYGQLLKAITFNPKVDFPQRPEA